ncbi:uncharacterized protein LTR77_010540 [Saxophila tyrrhenica]|uniref:Serine-rich protein n=1 Tax=Saxophila tyrrhenica TaxID=1690608 RepID=A0AAV9NYV3_9PEZI|nr:hypothetical protein LTR77_010540 [Saxophila tyrrhenica]
MFLDPDPKRAKQQANRNSGFFSSQKPIESPRDLRATARRKAQPLGERSKSQINELPSWRDAAISTVRLVKHSPPQSAQVHSDAEEGQTLGNEDDVQGRDVSVVKPASASDAGFPAKSVSDVDASANEVQKLEQPDTHSLLHTTPIHAQLATHGVPKKEWHRRSTSTGNYSTSSTLKGTEESLLLRRSDIRLSQGTTLRGTPTPTEEELRQRIDADDSLHSLQTLHEASPERSTLRVVAASEDNGSSVDDLSHSDSSASAIIQVFASPTPSPERRPAAPYRESSWQTLSRASPQTVYITRRNSDTRTPTQQPSQESVAQSKSTNPPVSSPNYVAFSSPARPRSGTYPLHHTYSFESIQSRLQNNNTATRPQTGRSLATASSWASLRPSSSHDTLPPLQVPKKRLRHKQGSLSLNAATSGSFTSGYGMDEDIDTLPYPREQFSSHLSTIASESERTDSRQLSHFSLGSGVLTGDDSSSIPLSGTWPRRRGSAPISSSFMSDAPRMSSEEEQEPGDMTLGIFREGSAKPQPLQPRAGAVPGERRYDGPLPPLPPIPRSRDSEENVDMLGELQRPQLREKRSGYSLRHRSNSTPSRSHSRHLSQISRSDTDRWSQASSLFPTWAKNFYGNGAALMSPSKVSLAAPGTPRRDNSHARNDSQWTERSITSRLGTGYTDLDNPSPTSSHFLPSIFRPRTRGRKDTDHSSKKRKSKRLARPSNSISRPASQPDSLQIFSAPLPPPADADVLPSGHPKYGSLKDASPDPQHHQHRPLPRKYSKQKHWDSMQFPRPMTKDRLSDFNTRLETPPHLERTKRSSYRLSTWRAPSFVESLDTLVRKRGNRQILLFALGFVCPLLWMVGAVLPVPERPAEDDGEVGLASVGASEEDLAAAMMKHEAGDGERRWREEKVWRKARWWRGLNRVMSVVGVLVIGAVVSTIVILRERGR